MMSCLLCDTVFQERLTFSKLYFLKKTEQTICSNCRDLFQKIPEQHCFTCFKASIDSLCKDCIHWQNHKKRVQHTSLYCYNEAMANYFSRYKFQGDYLLRKVFGKEFKLFLSQWKDYTIVPIPISVQRMNERGFNQVIGLLEAAGVLYQELLEKKETDKQSSKGKVERLRSEQPFSLITTSRIPAKVLLVDDIYTTGATIMHAREILVSAGVEELQSVSLAR